MAGQTRPIVFNTTLTGNNTSSVHYAISYRAINSANQVHTLEISQSLTKGSIYSPHKFTFRHPSGIVSYAMLRPPSKNATCEGKQLAKLPIIIANHGAGVEASNPSISHSLESLQDLCAWVLFPTGVTPWSGDDWHNWGFADVEAAVASIPDWIRTVSWTGPEVELDRWIMIGHSNGGQGTWYGLTHRPDRMMAAAPISGYASIQSEALYWH